LDVVQSGTVEDLGSIPFARSIQSAQSAPDGARPRIDVKVADYAPDKVQPLIGVSLDRVSAFYINEPFRIDADEIEIIDLDYETYHEVADMSSATGLRLKSPAHPGSVVKHEIIEPLDLTVTAAAKALGVTCATLSTLLNEHTSLSPEMALRLEKAFGVAMEPLMRMQNTYDIAMTRRREHEI
jgi:addiction module HigA family antidote